MSRFLKNFEKIFKRLIRNFVFRTNSKISPILVSEFSKELASAERILLLRQDRIGDLLISIPFLRNLRFAFPNKVIDILLSNKNYVAKSGIEKYVDNLFVWHKNLPNKISTLLRLRKIGYDLVIDLFDNPSITSSFIVNFLRPKFSLGFDKENRNVYTHILPLPDKSKFHIVDRVCSLLIPFGIDPEKIDKKLEFPIKEIKNFTQSSKKKLGIVVAGSSKSKFWGLDNLCAFIGLINAKYEFEIIVFGTREYKKILTILGKKVNVNLAPFTNDFVEFASMIAKCDYLITPDTSVVHLASSFQKPVLVFYTYVDKKYGMPWFPYGTKFKALISSKDNYSDISPNDALNAFSELIED